MRLIAGLACTCFIGSTMMAQSPSEKMPSDSLHYLLDEVEIISTRATKHTPVAFTNINSEQIAKKNKGNDIPFLLNNTPSLIITSDAGAGVGYTDMRIRGTDASRINITVNGVPMNDSESHKVYFVNMPDLASSLKDIQVQRGAGTSTDGAGAFGASVNMQTKIQAGQPYVTVDGGYGSYNTHKETVKIGSGLINNHWTVEGRFSNIGSDGYVDRASTKLASYMLSAGYFAKNTSVRFVTFNGWEETYHAWDYATKDQMKEYGRRYNPCGEYKDAQGNIHYYPNQTDNYNQQNYQVHLTQTIGSAWKNPLILRAAAFYTRGDGYYEQYKSDRTLQEYALSPYVATDGHTVTSSDLVRRKKMGNDFFGGVWSLSHDTDRLLSVLGGGFNRYIGDHFGQVIDVIDPQVDFTKKVEYYRNVGRKNDANIYLKEQGLIGDSWSYYVDVQYRYIDYKIMGSNENWDWNNDQMQHLNIHDTFHFWNPKVGLTYEIGKGQRAYASISQVHKEPTRNNYTDGYVNKYPKAEKMIDYELGYSLQRKSYSVGANLYYMDYTDQLVPTGKKNEIGEAVTSNIPDSYRMGIELMGSVQIIPGLVAGANATWSRNRIKNYKETLIDEHYVPHVIDHGDVQIAYSPEFMANQSFTFDKHGWHIDLQNQYIGEQFMNNAEQDDLKLDDYFVSNLNVSYTFHPKWVKAVTVGGTIYNLFDQEYETFGWTDSGLFEDKEGHLQRWNWSSYSVQAPIHFMGNVRLEF